jgi:hypothetical protein
MKTQLIDTLEICLQVLKQGGTVEECLNRFPALADELRPLLEQSVAARSWNLSPVPGNAVTGGRVRILNRAAQLRQSDQSIGHSLQAWRLVLIPVLVLAFMIITGNGLMRASANSLPGDSLYPLKRSVEVVSLFLAPNPRVKAGIQKEISTRRINETEILLSEKRLEAVDFGGQVSKQLADGWTISGIHVQVTGETEMVGALALGAQVNVRGQTQSDGSVLAVEVKVEADKHGNEHDRSGPSGGADRTPEPRITDDDPSKEEGEEEDKTPEPTDTGDHSSDPGHDGRHNHSSTEGAPPEHKMDENED